MSVPEGFDNHRHFELVVAAIATDLLQTDRPDQLPCYTALISALSLIYKPGIHFKFYKRYPAVVRASVDFLTRPRTADQRLALATASRDSCNCDRSTTYMQMLHGSGVKFAKIHEGMPDTALGDIMSIILNFVSTSTLGPRSASTPWMDTVTRRFRKARDVALRGKRGPWPSTPDDITPYGVETSIESLCDWIPHLPYVKLLTTVYYICMMIKLQAYPRLMICKIIPGAVIPFLARMVRDFTQPRDAKQSTAYVKELCLAADILYTLTIMDPHYFVMVLQLQQQQVAWDPLLATIQHAQDIVAFTRTDAGWGDMQSARNAHKIFMIFQERVRSALSTPFLSVADITADRTSIYHREPVIMMRIWYWHLYGGLICSAPGCTSTCVSVGRRLHSCAGCRHVFYCSRGCQRRAWKHPRLGHRTICAPMAAMFERIDVQYYTRRRAGEQAIYQTVSDMPQGYEGSEQAAFQNVCLEVLRGHEDLARTVVLHLLALYSP